uniref:Acidic phospholipase A2 PhTX-III (Fragments) n=1 Tax=Bothrocophias hyoprora TaxID=230469 RepID=PA23_BOTHY|nr:RecName: Full=Acidic phospholipase A2 PhTX-III; Short=svPLA2; AltName: Full=Phosphatidylcholine 2-acylhydrolase [Bothrocophias hyoprora]
DLMQFETLIMKSGVWYYGSYGCYCGSGGQFRPQDASDRCCFVHDCCYGKNGDIVCGGDDPCKKQICECDRVAATCFRDNKVTYDNKYWFFPAKFPPQNCKEESEPC